MKANVLGWSFCSVVTLVVSSPVTAQSAGASATSLPASQIPDLVVPPNGINLGSTSFNDGFSTLEPGITVLQYFRHNHLNSITDSNSHESSSFDDPRIDTTTSLTQFSITSPVTIGGNALGFDLLVPITRIDARFGNGGQRLADNGTKFGDLTFGPFLQFKPIMRNHRPIASFRIALDVIAPTGSFNSRRDLNQSSGYWSINPYVAWTALPAKGWEISGRAQYLYNFKTSKIPNAPEIPGFRFVDGQAGQLMWSNFTVTREVASRVGLGLNGYALQQITNDRINGISLPNTRRSAVYIGPGLYIDRLPNWRININAYLPVKTRNLANGPQLNILFIVPIR
ncbi:SphA family protein [Novosphingobium sp.]|uniref:SphA family protein n=1 Tax=Novosphingobium sp. TaxID=1874826 RepID=UPI002FE16ADF